MANEDVYLLPYLNTIWFKVLKNSKKRKITPPTGLEPVTFWLTARHSTN